MRKWIKFNSQSKEERSPKAYKMANSKNIPNQLYFKKGTGVVVLAGKAKDTCPFLRTKPNQTKVKCYWIYNLVLSSSKISFSNPNPKPNHSFNSDNAVPRSLMSAQYQTRPFSWFGLWVNVLHMTHITPPPISTYGF